MGVKRQGFEVNFRLVQRYKNSGVIPPFPHDSSWSEAQVPYISCFLVEFFPTTLGGAGQMPRLSSLHVHNFVLSY